MQQVVNFTYGNYYHVYNRGVNGCNIFRNNSNYEHFMNLFYNYLSPVVEIYAWVLMPNHFHFALRVKTKKEIEYYKEDLNLFYPNGMQPKIGSPSNQISKFLNSYAQAFNKRFERKGNLFEKRFKRKLIPTENYLKRAILYIHNNPIHHGYCENLGEYSWSSYLCYVSIDPEKSGKNKVMGWFDSQANFIKAHHDDSGINPNEFEGYLGLH